MRRSLSAQSDGGPSKSFRRLLAGTALGAALALSACQTQSPIQTDVPYQPADGVAVDLGPVQLRNLVVVSAGKDQPGVLSASVINTGADEASIAFAGDAALAAVTTKAAAHTTEQLSAKTPLQFAKLPVEPGDMLTLKVQAGTAPIAVVAVPVVAPLEYYKTITPSGAPPAPTTSEPPAATPTTTAAH